MTDPIDAILAGIDALSADGRARGRNPSMLETLAAEVRRLREDFDIAQKYADECEAAMHVASRDNNRLRAALRLIADDRGQCASCRADCEGERSGTTLAECPRIRLCERRPCVWSEGDHIARARKALGLALKPVSSDAFRLRRALMAIRDHPVDPPMTGHTLLSSNMMMIARDALAADNGKPPELPPAA